MVILTEMYLEYDTKMPIFRSIGVSNELQARPS
jgi:hypothetical protein